jgi:predicted Fe-Mo cluster-binding NifX family protein
MNILLPMNGDDTQEGSLVAINEVKKWALVTIEEGRVVEINFYDAREDIQEWIDAVVVVNDYEPVMSFIEEQVMVLVAHTQRSIDDIVEAFLFKELNDLAL